MSTPRDFSPANLAEMRRQMELVDQHLDLLRIPETAAAIEAMSSQYEQVREYLDPTAQLVEAVDPAWIAEAVTMVSSLGNPEIVCSLDAARAITAEPLEALQLQLAGPELPELSAFNAIEGSAAAMLASADLDPMKSATSVAHEAMLGMEDPSAISRLVDLVSEIEMPPGLLAEDVITSLDERLAIYPFAGVTEVAQIVEPLELIFESMRASANALQQASKIVFNDLFDKINEQVLPNLAAIDTIVGNLGDAATGLSERTHALDPIFEQFVDYLGSPPGQVVELSGSIVATSWAGGNLTVTPADEPVEALVESDAMSTQLKLANFFVYAAAIIWSAPDLPSQLADFKDWVQWLLGAALACYLSELARQQNE